MMYIMGHNPISTNLNIYITTYVDHNTNYTAAHLEKNTQILINLFL